MAVRRRLGVIGCGAVVQKMYLPSLAYFGEVHLARVNDMDPGSAAKVAGISGAIVSTQQQIMEDCEIVVIATPPDSHAGIVESFLSEGRTVICEKPFVGKRSDAERLVQLAMQRKSRLFVAHFRRNFPSVRLARSLIESGVLGEVVEVCAFEGGRFSWQAHSNYVYKDRYGGVLFDTGSHTIDSLLFAACLDTGSLEVTSVQTLRSSPEPSNELESVVSISRGGKEILGKFKFSRVVANSNKILIKCENGFVEFPVGLTNYVRMGGLDGRSVVVHARDFYADLMDCFALELKEMFSPEVNSIFSAERFINLTEVLESLNGPSR